MIKIGSKTFKSKNAIKEYLQEQMYRVKKGVPLTGVLFKVADYAFQMHENYDDKVRGMDYQIAVRTSSGLSKKYREYYIIRADGSEVEFSYKKALDGKGNKISVIKGVLRAVVMLQQLEAKNKYFAEHQDSKGYIKCAVTGLKAKHTEIHCDHYPVKFETIVANWFRERGLSSETFSIIDGGDDVLWNLVEDKELEKDFFNYHLEHATYRFVLAKVNLQAPRGVPEKF